MGRPLNKKFFGNRNIGTQGYDFAQNQSGQDTNLADDFIGGEGVASVNMDGSEGRYTNTVPTATFSDPSIPGGVTATASAVHVEALSANVDTVGSGYAYGDTLKLSPDGTWTAPQMSFTVTALQTVGVTILNDGSACDVGDKLRYDGSYSGGSWTTPLEILVTGSSSGNITSFTVTQAGVWTGSAAPTNTTGATRTQIAAGGDWNATDAQFNLTSYGVAAVSVAVAGDHTAVPGDVETSVSTSSTPSSGRSGAKLFVEYGVIGVDIDEKGSGYINAADAAITFSDGDIYTATSGVTLTTDNGGYSGYGDLNVGTNQENAILIYAKTTSGGSSKLGDIQKQANARSYKVRTADGTAVCKLVAGSPAVNQATINATDSAGGTYYVTKLTAHKALLTRNSGTQFATGQSVKWTFGSAVANSSVTIDNA
jgi:hypothetical protein